MPPEQRRLRQAKRRPNTGVSRGLCWGIAPLDPTYALRSLEIEARGEPVESLVAIDDLAPVSLSDAVIQLCALFGGHSRIKGFVEQSGLLDMLEKLAAFGKWELGNELNDMCLGLGHESSLSHARVSCTRRAGGLQARP